MTFGKELSRLRKENPLFANHYINYKELKDAVDEADVAKVMNLLRTELDKINDIVEVQWGALIGELKARMRKLGDKEGAEVNAESLENLSQAVVRLHSFIETNYLGFQKVVKKCAESQETASCSWFLARVEAASFRQHRFDELLVPLGRLYTAFRRSTGFGMEAALHGLDDQALPMSGDGNAQVFFVPTSQVMKAKVALLKVLEPAATIIKAKTNQGTRDTSRVTAEFSQKLTHVYFESNRGDQYAERLRRRIGGFAAATGPVGVLLQCHAAPPPLVEAGAPGDPSDPYHEVSVEIQDETYKVSTFSLQQKLMPAFLAGKATSNSPLEKMAAETIQKEQLRPAVSSSAFRSSFTSASSAGKAGVALVSIDEQVTFRDEAALADDKAWCFAASRTGAASTSWSQVDFPGAILRIWLPASSANSLLGLLGVPDLDLKPVPGFSEALHGTALLHRELANPLPPWIPSETLVPAAGRSTLVVSPHGDEKGSLDVAGAKSQRVDKKTSEDKKVGFLKPTEAARSLRRTWCAMCAGGDAAAPARADPKLIVDCKTPMAIERTLLRWMRSTILLGSLSSLLMSGSSFDMQLNGVLLGLVCLIFTIFPLMSYVQRSRELSNPKAKQPKVDRTMPRILALSFSAVLFSTVCVNVFARGSLQDS
mmetsp:Transcript_35230/g.114058  ORF Transcript_35230/g.114058 Transcript_35230/m.114058 type:complete len:654 (-) Transcript_35230:122-2083(-)